MLFQNPWLLAGLVGLLIPVILHLIRRQSAKPYDWGAMRFLFDTVAARRKRMEWEDFLLMAARCLLITLIALAVARPFVPPDTEVPWFFVVPLGLLGFAFFGGSFVLTGLKVKWLMRLAALLMVVGSCFLIWQEKSLNLKRFQTSAYRDVSLVIDGSSSMLLRENGESLFEQAVSEAQTFVKEAPKGTAFSVVLGGPAPELKTGTPLTHRADVLEVLESLEPVGGPFRAHDALGVATLSLAEGRGSSKDLIVFTDQQRVGWNLESATSWGNLGEAWEGLPSGAKPRLLLRTFASPEEIRNVAVTEIALSREVVGTDREVVIRVSVENTGTEVVTPGIMEVRAGEVELEPKGVGQIGVGETVVVEYRHQFSKVGPQVITAKLEGGDDLVGDDVSERALWIRKRLPVLIVEGNGGASFFERAGSYLGLALAPVTGENRFVDPRVVEASTMTRENFDEDAVIVLADVARLPESVARKISDFVMKGGGLWVIAGEKMESGFYENWLGGDGAVMPLKIGEMVLPEGGVQVVQRSFDHPSLRMFQEEAGADLGEALIEGYRKSSDLIEGALVAARYSDGGVFLATRNYGRGRIMVSTTGFHSRLGNLPARRSYLPFVHEITNWLTQGRGLELNVRASWSPSLVLPGGLGLSAQYRPMEGSEREFSRIDGGIDFDWKEGSPGNGLRSDRFEVTWSGSLVPPVSGDYVFEILVDDFFELTIGGEKVYESSERTGRSDKVQLARGKAVSFKARFQEERSAAFVKLSWERPDGVKEVIPASSFFAVSDDEGKLILGEGEAKDPQGKGRKVEAFLGRRGKSLEVGGPAVPGEYRVTVPAAVKSDFLGEGEIPMVVSREGSESRRDPWNQDDRSLIRREIDLLETDSVEDVLAALKGEGFGRELWRIFAWAALVLFFIEGVLARWVSKSRRAGEDVKVDFEKRHDIPEAFLDSVIQTKGGKS